MSRRMTFGSPQWRDSLGDFNDEFFRGEFLQDYKVDEEQESLAQFTAGQSVDFGAGKAGWIRRIEAAADRGAVIARVRIIRWPLTEYTEYEIPSYGPNVAAGERVCLLDASPRTRALVTRAEAFGDFQLFDRRRLVRLRYDEHGRPVDAVETRNPLLIRRARRLRDALMSRSVSYKLYMTRTGSLATAG